ncbi:MAG: hypothetical protein LBB59_00205, partial [Campylobacteraceae bacterium]|nr:hypothetical protein [Campylobacteraceae bacterium]
MSKSNLLITLCCGFILSGCTLYVPPKTTQRVTPVPPLKSKDICIISNPKVRQSFLEIYNQVLETKGYTIKILEPNATVVDCPITSTYVANWSFNGFAAFLRHVTINVFEDGYLKGEVYYENQGNFVNGEEKIT